MFENKENVCRLCLSQENLMFPIFRNEESTNGTSFRSKILKCTSIKIFADDNLPLKVCFMCLHKVEKFFKFLLMCQNSENVLQSEVKIADINDIKQKQTFYANFEQVVCNSTDTDAFSCFVCSAMFLTSDTLINHISKSHHNIELFFCKGCKTSFTKLTHLQIHLNNYHVLNCLHCDFVFKNVKNYQEHIKKSAKENFICKHCSKSFRGAELMKKHELDHMKKTCSYCVQEFVSNLEYENHLKNCNQVYACKFCDKVVKLKKDLIQHVNECHSNSTAQRCNYCQNIYASLKNHKCRSDNAFQCKNCEAAFLDEASLTSHMTSEHKEHVFSCTFCTKTFTLKSSLKRHEKSHSGVKPYQCKFCHRKFKDSSACVVHTRTHTGEHPFRCEECHKNFKQLANLKMHTYRHHKKNQKSLNQKDQLSNQQNHKYEEICSEGVGQSISEYQEMSQPIQTNYNQSINILIPENH